MLGLDVVGENVGNKDGVPVGVSVGKLVGKFVGPVVWHASTQFAGQFLIKLFFWHLLACFFSVSACNSEQKNGSPL